MRAWLAGGRAGSSNTATAPSSATVRVVSTFALGAGAVDSNAPVNLVEGQGKLASPSAAVLTLTRTFAGGGTTALPNRFLIVLDRTPYTIGSTTGGVVRPRIATVPTCAIPTTIAVAGGTPPNAGPSMNGFIGSVADWNCGNSAIACARGFLKWLAPENVPTRTTQCLWDAATQRAMWMPDAVPSCCVQPISQVAPPAGSSGFTQFVQYSAIQVTTPAPAGT